MKKIAVVSMVKNEADVIESFVRHSLTFSDFMIIADHRSSDKTHEILSALRDEGLPIIIHMVYEVCHAQSEVVTGLVSEAVNEHGADIVLPLDADEFVVNTDNGFSCREIIDRLSVDEAYFLRWRLYEPLCPPEENNRFLLSRPAKRGTDYEKGGKIIVGGRLFRKKPFTITQGNHGGYRETEQGKVGVPLQDAQFIHIAHFNWRSDEQYAAKIVAAWPSTVAKYSVNTASGGYKKQYVEMMNGLRAEANVKIVSSENINLLEYVEPQMIRYSGDCRPDALRNLMDVAVIVAEAYAEEKVVALGKRTTIVIPFIGDTMALKKSVDSATRQTYPLKEIIIIDIAGIGKEAINEISARHSEICIIKNEDGDDGFEKIEKMAKGDYVQWIFPGDTLHPCAVARMTAAIELSDRPLSMLVNNGEGEFSDFFPYMNFPRSEPFYVVNRLSWHRELLRDGKIPSTGVTGLFVRREMMRECGWMRCAFMKRKFLPLIMYDKILKHCAGEAGSVAAGIVQEKYVTHDSRHITPSDWIWHQLEHYSIISLNDDDNLREACIEGLRHIADGHKLALSFDKTAVEPDLWQAYTDMMNELSNIVS